MRNTLVVDTNVAVVDRYVSPAEAAFILGIEIQTLRTWRNRQQGPRYRKFGRQIRYSLSDLREYAHRAIVHRENAASEEAHA
jgi:hypothetical protein